MKSSPAAPTRIGVLTFHRCINYGSYWQARCLVEGLRARGHDAELVDHDCPSVKRAEWRCAMQPLLPNRSPRSDFPLYSRKARRLLSAVSALPLSPQVKLDSPEEIEGYDAIVVGSDEVWNMRHPWYGGKPVFYGHGVSGRLVSYAASFGNHDAADGLDPWWADRLRSFSAISVRDWNSHRMVQGALGRAPELVLDPCLQFPPPPPGDDEAEIPDRPYLAVYGHSFPDWFASAVRAWATRRGLVILSIGYRNEWADEQRIDAGPGGFSALIARSAAVATNFFHGCVFSLLHQRPFACAATPYRANKVGDLVRTVGAEERLVREGEEQQVEGLLSTPLSEAVGRRIAALRHQSDRYLSHALA